MNHYHRAYLFAAVTAALMAAGIALASAAAAVPYGSPPASLTWTAPPDWQARLAPDGGSRHIPHGITELDIWATDRRGRPVYRLRQRFIRDAYYGRALCWTSAVSRRCRVVFERDNRDLYSDYAAARYGLVVYGWRS